MSLWLLSYPRQGCWGRPDYHKPDYCCSTFYYCTVRVAAIFSPCGNRPTKKNFAQKGYLVFGASGPPAGDKGTRGTGCPSSGGRGGILRLIVIFQSGLSGCLTIRVRVEGIPGRCGTGGAQASTRCQVGTVGCMTYTVQKNRIPRAYFVDST